MSLVLLYDGECGFCDRTVKFAMRQDRQGALRFAPLQGAFAATIRTRHPQLAGVDSLVWVEHVEGEERIWIRSAGALRLGLYLGGVWRVLAWLAAIVPTALRDLAYDAFARRRYRWFGTSEACELPTPEERTRFIA